MIVIKCKNNSDLSSVYNLTKAFFPHEEIKQEIDKEQESRLQLTLDRGSCFSVFPNDNMIGERERYLIKRVYDYLSEYTGKTLPWGILTGVRPTKLAMKVLKEYESSFQGVGTQVGKNSDHEKYEKSEKPEEREKSEKGEESEEQLYLEQILIDKYYLSEEKAKLALKVAKRENELIKGLDYEDGFSLFVSIPFCPSICSYCTFGSGDVDQWQGRMDEYVQRLSEEITQIGRIVNENGKHCNGHQRSLRNLQTIYIGGGTPTTLSTEQFSKLFNAIKESFSLDRVVEYTVEAGRPETITKEKLRLFKEAGVNRISINPQTMNQKTLDKIERNHKVDDVVTAFNLAREEGFDNINMDLIVGLPSEGMEEIRLTLSEVAKLEPDNLTIHTLAKKRGAKLAVDYHECNIDEMLHFCYDTAMEMELVPYYLYRQKNIAGNFENVGFAKVDKAGIYNILIIEELHTILGVGAGAITKFVIRGKDIERGSENCNKGEKKEQITIKRIGNTKDIGEYIMGGREIPQGFS